LQAFNPTHMKLHAQEILQYSGYPLEPIVAKEVKKTYEEKVQKAVRQHYLAAQGLATTIDIADNNKNWDAEWFGNYE
jgi:hypothetical protein